MSTNGLSYFPGNRSTNGTSGYAMGTSTITSLSSGYVIYANSSKTLTSTLVSLTAINQLITNTFSNISLTGTVTFPTTSYSNVPTSGNYSFLKISSAGLLSYDSSTYITSAQIVFKQEVVFCSITNASTFYSASFGYNNFELSVVSEYNAYRFYGNDVRLNTDLCIIPGYKGSTKTDNYITYSIDGTNTHYHYYQDDIEVGTVLIDGNNTYNTKLNNTSSVPTYNIVGARFLYSNQSNAVAVTLTKDNTTWTAGSSYFNYMFPSKVINCFNGNTSNTTTSPGNKVINPSGIFTLDSSSITINNTNPGYYRVDINFLFFCAPNTTYYVGLLDTGINGTTAINSIAATYCSLNTTFTMSNTSQTFSLSGIIYVDSANNWTNGPTSYTSGVLNLMLAAKSTGTAYMFWSIDIQRIS